MKWAITIWDLFYKEHKSPQEIVTYFDNPLVTAEYVDTVIGNISYLKTPYLWKDKAKKRTFSLGTRPNTRSREVQEIVEMHGGKEGFLEALKTKTIWALAKEWGMRYHELRNYKRNFINGRMDRPRSQLKLDTLIRKNKKIKKRPPAPKDLRELW